MFLQALEYLWQFRWPTAVNTLEWTSRRFGRWLSILTWGRHREGIGPRSQLALPPFPCCWEVLALKRLQAGCRSRLLHPMGTVVRTWSVFLQREWVACHKSGMSQNESTDESFEAFHNPEPTGKSLHAPSCLCPTEYEAEQKLYVALSVAEEHVLRVRHAAVLRFRRSQPGISLSRKLQSFKYGSVC